MNRKLNIFFINLILLTLTFCTKINAQCNIGDKDLDLFQCIVLKDGSLLKNVYTDPSVIINIIVRNLFTIVGFILFLYIIIAGYKLIGSDNSNSKQEASSQLTSAAIGFGIMFIAYWIVQIVKAVTGADIPI